MRLLPIVSLIFMTGTAVQGAELTADEAVRRGLARQDIAASFDARRESARGRAATAGRWANPEIAYNRESLDLPGGESEERSLLIRQRFNLAGVNGLERDAAERRRDAEMARTDLAERELNAEIRRYFYEARAATRRTTLLRDWYNRLEELVTAVGNRVNAGDASQYDLARLEREQALLQGDLLTATASAESTREKLFSLIGGKQSSLSGEILPPSAGDLSLNNVIPTHPGLSALSAEADSAALSAKAAQRRRWPEVTLGLGHMEFNQGGVSSDGNIISLSVEIPLFNRDRGEYRSSENRARQLRADRRIAEAQLEAELSDRLRTLESRRDAAIALRESTDTGDASLAMVAESAYAAGEISVMELIDAHRSELAARQEAIDRALAARRAYIELLRLRGEPQ